MLGASDIFIGVNALDYSGYPDCRPDGNLATKASVEGRQNLRIHTPLIQLTKAQILRPRQSLAVDHPDAEIDLPPLERLEFARNSRAVRPQ